MTRSIALTNGFADTYALPTPKAPRQAAFGGRIMNWLTKSQQHGVEREIHNYVAERGFDHFTDSIERDIECRFLARQHDCF
ncbi:MAG TPA: hypothetical protein VGG01_01915 [Xanthobacteraceae bacterium]|jgi:hypothetical protein